MKGIVDGKSIEVGLVAEDGTIVEGLDTDVAVEKPSGVDDVDELENYNQRWSGYRYQCEN